MSIAARLTVLVLATLAVALPARAADGDALLGQWMGTAKGPRPVDVILIVEQKDGKPVAIGALPGFGSLGEAIGDAKFEGARLTGTIPAMVGRMFVDVTLAGGALEGKLLATPPGAKETIEMPVRLERTVDPSTVAGARTWAGQLDAGTQQVMMGLTLAEAEGGRWYGTVDIPVQGLARLPLYVSRAADGTFTARMPVQGDATLTLREDQGNLQGTFAQGTFKGDIRFVPHEAGKPLPAPGRKARPQDPKPPFPYEIRTVRYQVPAGHTIEGTLLVPNGATKEKRVPGVLLVTGSGPQDRDESLMGHRPFEVIADALARRGIAVLRCDDRGVGASDGSYADADTDGFASDAMFGFVTLAAGSEVDPARVGIIGHSEGGTIAPMVVTLVDADASSPSKVAFIAMLAGTGVDGDRVLRVQNRRLLLASGKTEAQIAAECEAHAAFLDAAKQGADDVVLRAKARELVIEQMKLRVADMASVPPSAIDAQADAAVRQMATPWMKRFLTLDPAQYLSKVTCPVLALNGSLDTQVTVEQDLPAIEAALKKAKVPYEVKAMPGLNHLFQPAKTGGIEEYATIETTVDPSVLDLLATWILAQPPRPPASK
jgi:hypothetical protein